MASAKKPKKEKTPEPFFKELVSVYFQFCRGEFGEEPTFDGSAPRDFKDIIKSLRERAQKSNIEWTLEVAQSRLLNFLMFANMDKWLHDNFILSNINRQKDKIFFKIRAAINGRSETPFE